MIKSNMNPFRPKDYYAYSKSGNENTGKGIIKYSNMQIPTKNILCVREAPDSYIYPKSIITLLVENPQADNMPTVTEYEYSGSSRQWTDAIKKAEKTGSTVSVDFWG